MKKIERHDGYEELLKALVGAYDQAAIGKGKERHATGEPFEEQICCYLLRHTGISGAVFQTCKKALESIRLPYPANINELRGAINYAASAIIELERLENEKMAKVVVAGTGGVELETGDYDSEVIDKHINGGMIMHEPVVKGFVNGKNPAELYAIDKHIGGINHHAV